MMQRTTIIILKNKALLSIVRSQKYWKPFLDLIPQRKREKAEHFANAALIYTLALIIYVAKPS